MQPPASICKTVTTTPCQDFARYVAKALFTLAVMCRWGVLVPSCACPLCSDAEFIPSLDEALSVPWPDVLVSVAKQVTRGRVDDVSVEQSDLKVSVGGSQSLWRTVCIESNSLPNIQKLLKREVREGHVDLQDYLMGFANTIVQGYPAFILTLIQNTVSRDNGGTSS